jgi:replicative DNA helicase
MASVKTENIEVENALLFIIFKFKETAAREIVKLVLPEFFSQPVQRKIFKNVIAEYEVSGAVPSLAGLYRHMLGHAETEADDKIRLKEALENIKAAPACEGDIPAFSKQLRELYCIRKYLKALNTRFDDLDKSGDIVDTLSKTEKDLLEIRKSLDVQLSENTVHYKEGIEDRVEYAKQILTNPTSVGLVRTGFVNFDKWLPPISPGAFVIYQSRTNMGKSMFLMGTANINFNIYGLRVIIITIEMSAAEYAFRLDANVTGIEHEKFAKGTIIQDEELVTRWRSKVGGYGEKSPQDLMIYWVPENCTPAKIDHIISSNPFKPDLVVVDYAGDMKAGLKGVPEYDPKSHAEIYSRLKELAGKHRCVMFTAQQTKRGVKKNITTEDGSWSDVASNKADIMIAIEKTKEDELHEEEVEGDRVTGRLTISIIKGRNVPKLMTHIVPQFHKMRWLEKEMAEKKYAGNIGYEKTDKQKVKEGTEKAEAVMAKETPSQAQQDGEMSELLAGVLD